MELSVRLPRAAAAAGWVGLLVDNQQGWVGLAGLGCCWLGWAGWAAAAGWARLLLGWDVGWLG